MNPIQRFWSTLFLILVFPSCLCIDIIAPNQSIGDGDVLVSSGQSYTLGFFGSGIDSTRHVGIWYHKVSERTVVWVANRDNPIDGTSGILAMNKQGSLVIYENNRNSVPVWSTTFSASSTTNCTARLLDSGNLVLVQEDRKRVLWQSFDHATDMKLGPDMKIGLNWSLSSWKSKDDPRTIFYGIDPRGYPHSELIIWAKYEKSGPLAKKGIQAILIVSVGVTLVLIIFLVCWFARKRRKGRDRERRNKSPLSFTSTSNCLRDLPFTEFDVGTASSDLPLFHLSSIAAATNNFSDANKLGEGGFGSVYKGLLHDGKEIAVKRVAKYSGQGINEFRNEVELIAKLQHRNLVRIIGCCLQGGEIRCIKNSNFYDESNPSNLVGCVWDLRGGGRALELVDTSMGDSYPGDQVLRCVEIGLLCVQESAMDRPSMSNVVIMSSNDTSTLPSPKQPAFILKRSCNSGDPSTSEGSHSINEVTITMLGAR